MKYSGGPLDNQTLQTEGKTAPLAKVQLCGFKNQTLETFVVSSSVCTPSLIVQLPARSFHF